MFVDKFAQYILKGRRQSIFLGWLFVVLPFLGWAAAIIVGFNTLVKGTYEGFIILLWMALPYAVLAALGHWLPLAVNFFGGMFIVWLMSVLIASKFRWAFILELTALLGVLAVCLVHFLYPGISLLWTQLFIQMAQYVSTLTKLTLIPVTFLKPMAHFIAQFATGAQAAYLLFLIVIELAISRWMQYRLNRSGSLLNDWINLRLHVMVSLIAIAAIIMAWLDFGFSRDILVIVLAPFLIAGISLFHALFCRWRHFWLWIFYSLVIISAMIFPMALSVLVLVAMLDSVFNFRKHNTI